MGRRTLALVLTALIAGTGVAVALASTDTGSVSQACGIKQATRKAAPFVGFGGGDSFTITGDARRCTMNEQVDVGIGFLRQTFEQGQYKGNPTYFDDWVAEAARHKITILPIVFVAAPSGRGAKAPKNSKAVGKYAASLVKRYGPKGTLWNDCECPKRPIKVWQYWNEPNLKVYWQPKPNAKAYTKSMGIVRSQMRKAPGGKGIQVISGGLPDSKSSKPGVYKYIAQMYKAGAAKKMDGLAFHPYAHNASGTMDKLKKVRKFMNKHGDKGAKIWVTEIGWATAGPKSEFRLGEGQTATQIKKVVPALWKARKGLKVGGFQYYTWSDKTACSTCIANHWGYYAGLIKLDGTHKKTFAASKKAVRGLH